MKLTARIMSILLAAACLMTFAAGWINIKDIESTDDYWNRIVEGINDDFDDLEDGLDLLSESEEEYSVGIDTYLAGMKAIDEGGKVIAEGEKALQQGTAALSVGYAAINEGKAQLEEGRAAYEQGLAEYEAAKAQLEEGKAALAAVEPIYNAVMSLYSKAQQKLVDAENARASAAAARDEGDEERAAELESAAEFYEWEYQQAEEMMNFELNGYSIAGLTGEYEAALAQITMGEEAMAEAERQLAEGKAFLDENTALLETAEAQIGSGAGMLGSARKQLEDGKAQLAATEAQMNSKRSRLSEIETEQTEIFDAIENAIEYRNYYDDNREPLVESVEDRIGGGFEYVSRRISEETGDEFVMLDFDAAYDVVDAGRDFADELMEGAAEELDGRRENLKLAAGAAGAGLLAAILGICGVYLPAGLLGIVTSIGGAYVSIVLCMAQAAGYSYSSHAGSKVTIYLTMAMTAAAVLALSTAVFAFLARNAKPTEKKVKRSDEPVQSMAAAAIPAAAAAKTGRVSIPRYDPNAPAQFFVPQAQPAAAQPAYAPVPQAVPVKVNNIGGRVSIPRYQPPVESEQSHQAEDK